MIYQPRPQNFAYVISNFLSIDNNDSKMERQVLNTDVRSPSPSSSPPPIRQNRWTGPPSTYLSLIEQERGLSASLDQTRDQDLSVHLYNAHALKTRARKFWERKNKGEEFDEEGEGMGWAPPKGWTAWPLPPNEVPRDGEIVGEDDGMDMFTFRREKDEAPSMELEEHLVAITLKFARERFEGRESAGSDEEINDDNHDNHDNEKGFKAGTEELGHVFEEIAAMSADSLDKTMDNLEGEDHLEPIIKESPEPPHSKARLKPVVSVDDERSAEILRPSIRHTLSKLDEVLIALHYARKTCHQYTSRSAPNTDDETGWGEYSDQGVSTPTKRPRGRPRKFANLTLLPKESSQTKPQNSNPALFRTKKTHRGRPQKVYERLEGENQQEYLVRIARLQKKALPSFAMLQPPYVPPPRSPSAASSKSRKSPTRRATSEELKIVRQKKLGLRDWSEVLGSAALVGFPPDVIVRATQRCADLFGEGMTMMTLPEAPFAEKDSDFMTTYLPEEIPDFGPEDESPDQENDESEIKTSRSTSRARKRNAPAELETKSWFCPIEDCRRQNKGFGYISGLRRHLEKFHHMAEDKIDELLDDSEEMDGAVHIDGFLKPLRQKRGVRGKDIAPRKVGRWARENASSSEVEDKVKERSRGSSGSGSAHEGDDGDDSEGGCI